MKFLAILVLALATACAYEIPVPFREVPYDAESESRIIDGKEAINGQIPHQGGLLINGGSWCGCSLISKDYALTAAHCTSGLSFGTVFFGEVARTGGINVDFTRANVIQHAEYNANYIINDISLINLPKAIAFSEFIQPVKLPERSGIYSTYAGDQAQISGWGKTSDTSGVASLLMSAAVTIITNPSCAGVYGSNSVDGGVICAGTSEGKSTCNGDSGGPLTVGGVQVGIVSYGASAGCTLGYPIGFARITYFRDWIYKNCDI